MKPLPPPLTAQDVIKAVARRTRLRPSQITTVRGTLRLGAEQDAHIASARQLASWLIYHGLKLKYREVAVVMGYASPYGAAHAADRVEEWRRDGTAWKQVTDELLAVVKARAGRTGTKSTTLNTTPTPCV